MNAILTMKKKKCKGYDDYISSFVTVAPKPSWLFWSHAL